MTTTYLDGLVALAALSGAKPAHPVHQYLTARGLVSTLDQNPYRLGYVGPASVDHAIKTVEMQYAVPDEFKRWARYALGGRLLFPLTHPLGFVVGLQTRSLDPSADEKVRYLRFRPRMYRTVYAALFGADIGCRAALESQRLVCVEGPIDALAVSLHTPDVVATLTSAVSVDQRDMIFRWADVVVALFDMDDAGRRAAGAMTRSAPPGVVVTAPEFAAHDPADLQRADAQALARLLGQTTVDDVLAILRRV